MAKIITVTLGGKERTVDVGKFWFTKFYGETIGDDPLNSPEQILQPNQQFGFLVAVVYAGMLADYKANKKEVDFKKSDVEDWLGDLEDEQAANLLIEYTEVMTGKQKEPGEADPQEPQNG